MLPGRTQKPSKLILPKRGVARPPGRNDSSRLRCLKEPSSLEKRRECRVMERWLQVLEEVPEQGQCRALVVEPWVGHRQEAE